MKDLLQYISKIHDPYLDENEQDDLLNDAYDSYAADKIYNSIGTHGSSVFINLHWKEIRESMLDDEYSLFISNCFHRLCKVYKLHGITQFFVDNSVSDVVQIQSELILSIELNKLIPIIASSFSEEMEVVLSLQGTNLKQFIEDKGSEILKNVLKSKIPDIFKYFLQMTEFRKAIQSIIIICNRDFHEFKSQFVLNKLQTKTELERDKK